MKWLYVTLAVVLLIIAGAAVWIYATTEKLPTPVMYAASDPYATEINGEKINLNTATEAELAQLPGIGNRLAKRIIEYRDKYGKFDSTMDICEVEGIGYVKYRTIRPLITVYE